MRNFIRLYPLLLGNMVPEDDQVWNLLISFTNIVEMISSPSYIIGETLVPRETIEEFCVDYLRIIPEATHKPKAQFLTQYPSQILEFGPPLNHSAIEFGAKNKQSIT